jgi:hypothetical protein
MVVAFILVTVAKADVKAVVGEAVRVDHFFN